MKLLIKIFPPILIVFLAVLNVTRTSTDSTVNLMYTLVIVAILGMYFMLLGTTGSDEKKAKYYVFTGLALELTLTFILIGLY